jgi:hypothetical protein
MSLVLNLQPLTEELRTLSYIARTLLEGTKTVSKSLQPRNQTILETRTEKCIYHYMIGSQKELILE